MAKIDITKTVQNFGKIKNVYNEILVESVVTKNKDKKDLFKSYVKTIKENEAFILSSKDIIRSYEDRYKKTASLYYLGQPDFNDIISRIGNYIDIL